MKIVGLETVEENEQVADMRYNLLKSAIGEVLLKGVITVETVESCAYILAESREQSKQAKEEMTACGKKCNKKVGA